MIIHSWVAVTIEREDYKGESKAWKAQRLYLNLLRFEESSLGSEEVH